MSGTRPKTMRVVQRSGERFSYRVESQTNPEIGHLVDLTANEGMGSCTCEFYTFTVSQNQRRALAAGNPPQEISYRPEGQQRAGVTQCRHIYGVRRQFIRTKILPFLSSFSNGQPENIGEVLRELMKWKGIK